MRSITSSLTVIVACAVMCMTTARAAVVLTFSEQGANVIATASGSLAYPIRNSTSTANQVGGGDQSLYFYNGGVGQFFAGSHTSSGLSAAPTSAVGDTFGYFTDFIYAPTTVLSNTSYSPNVVFTWANTTLAALFPSTPLTSTPRVVFTTTAGGDTISFVGAVPEPSRGLLVLCGLGLLVTRRRR